MPNITGPVLIEINGRAAIAVTGWNKKKSIATKQHVGGYGVFGTSQSAGKMVSGSFKYSIFDDGNQGVEFDFEKEFGGSNGGNMKVRNLSGTWRRAYTGVKLAEDDVSNDETQGTTDGTINWTAEKELPL